MLTPVHDDVRDVDAPPPLPDSDGVPDLPRGLETVATYPALFAELARRGWSDADLRKLAGENFLRVLRANEATARKLARN